MLLIPLILIIIGVVLLVYGVSRAGRGNSGQSDDSHGVDVVWRVGRSDRKRRR